MNKKELNSILSVTRNEETNLIEKFTFHGLSDAPTQKIYGWEKAQQPFFFSVFYAGADLLRHKLFEHEYTQVGCHFRKERGTENGMFQIDLAAVSVFFDNYDEIFHVLPTIERFPDGWARVDRVDRVYTFGSFDDPEVASRRHTALDYFLKGYNFELFVPTYLARPKKTEDGRILEAWAEVMVDTFFTTNDAEALQKRNDRINKKIDRDFLYEGVKEAKKNGAYTPEHIASVNGSTIITMYDNKKVPLDELPNGYYKIFNKTRIVETIFWDGDGRDETLKLGRAAKRNWKVKAL